jgi:hypothetical protein
MAMNSETRLGCGRLVDDVLANADSPPDRHERSCPFCQEVRDSLGQLSDATAALTALEAQSPDYTPSSRVKDVVMQLVHVEVRRGRSLPLVTPSDGTPAALAISKQAVLDVIWRTADDMTELRAGYCAVQLDGPAQQPGQPTAVRIDIHVTVAAGSSIPDVTASLRTRLHDQIAAETGLRTGQITVAVEDLFHD